MTPEEIAAAQAEAALRRLSDQISLITQGFSRWAQNTGEARNLLANPLIINAIENLTDEQLVAMNHGQYQAQWFRDALQASIMMRAFVNSPLNPDDPESPSISEVFYRVVG